MSKDKKQKTISITAIMVIIAIIVQTTLFMLPLIYSWHTNQYELDNTRAYCTENYKEIFSDSQTDFINYERTNEDIIRLHSSSAFKDCQRALTQPDYWKWKRNLDFLWLSFSLQLFWLIWGWVIAAAKEADGESKKDESENTYY